MAARAVKMTKKGSILKETDNALEWFPELEKLLENFNVSHIKIKLHDTDDYFTIVNEGE